MHCLRGGFAAAGGIIMAAAAQQPQWAAAFALQPHGLHGAACFFLHGLLLRAFAVGLCIYGVTHDETLYSSNGYEWIDPIYEDYTYDEQGKQEILEQLEYELFDGIFPEETDLLADAQEAYDVFEEMFRIADLSIAIGNIPIKVLSNPVNKVDFSLMSGFVQNGEPLELSVKDGAQVHYSLNGGEYVEYTQPIEMEGYIPRWCGGRRGR